MSLELLPETITPDRYTLGKLVRAVRNPALIRHECNRLGLKLNRAIHRHVPREGFDVMGADWDTLVILDGCRYDLFADAHQQFVPDGQSARLGSVTSAGSGSQEFIKRNYRGKQLHDTVYITSNPFVRPADSEIFHAVENLFLTGWDSDLNTVRPETVTEAVIAAHERYPNKRLIAHYIQPHYPFIGERGRQFTHRGLYPEDSVAMGRDADTEPDIDASKRVWGRLQHGEIDRDTVAELYRENLEVTVPHVRELLAGVDGKTVITSDHGNLLGERLWPIPVRGYGHPEGIYVAKLVAVPWLELDAQGRRDVTADPPVGRDDPHDIDDETVKSRLKHLGYHD
jgi:hypothetical protein